MADQEKDVTARDYSQSRYIGENIPNAPSEYREETASELIGPVSLKKTPNQPSDCAEAGCDALPLSSNQASDYHEETAAEIAAPVSLARSRSFDNEKENYAGDTGIGAGAGTGVGFLALALSIISLFVMPVLFGAAGIVLGFIARSRGAGGLGAWAVGIGIVSIVIGIFVTPFF